MTRLDSAAVPVPPNGHDAGDGYEWIDRLGGTGWHAVASWGAKGWDLGAWPLVVVAHHDAPTGDAFAVAQYIEGDVDVQAFNTRRERDWATDRHAAHWWRQGTAQGPPDLPEDNARLAVEHRHPFTWHRLPR